MISFLANILMILPHIKCYIPLGKCTVGDPLFITHKKYHSEDLVIGGITSQIYAFSNTVTFIKNPSKEIVDDFLIHLQNFQHILALEFAIKEINENLRILPNITLGIHDSNSYFLARWIYLASMELLSSKGRFIQNYKCDLKDNVVAVLAGPNAFIGQFMSNILSVYKIPQLTYGSAPVIDDSTQAVFLHRAFPNEDLQIKGIIQLLLYFQWIWIGLIVQSTEKRDRFLQNRLAIFSQKGICFDFVEELPKASVSDELDNLLTHYAKVYNVITRSNANVVIIYCENDDMVVLRMLSKTSNEVAVKSKDKIWIIPAQMEFSSLPFQRQQSMDFIHGSLSFQVSSEDFLEFKGFLQRRKVTSAEEDSLIRVFWESAFQCSFSNAMLEEDAENECTGEEPLETLPKCVFDTRMTGQSYSVYNAVHAVAHALQAMLSTQDKLTATRKGSKESTLKENLWQAQPTSACNDHCFSGSNKIKIEGKPFCCYDCLQCPKGKISNKT
ncbi:vomeronasal type-2 receptor 26-like, partial [Python bivittatus]|uniref:Vomeronasal type-2 receptor 26-like n=1 Tax=Python bivittatus TaxID=176946 RepID=A0A9F5J513_PYTBI